MSHVLHVHAHITYYLFVVKIMCPDLSIPNGVVTISPADQGFLSRTTYECGDGYALKGDDNRVCQMDDSWNGTNPECGEWFL